MNAPSRGFTLLEVLVALAVVALGMSAVLAAMTSAADTAYFLRDKSFAEWIAFNHIAEIRLKPQMPKKGKSDGEVEFAGRKWMWQQEVLPMEMKGTFRIDVSVRPQDAAPSKGDSRSGGWYATESGMIGDAVERGLSTFEYLGMRGGFPPPEGGRARDDDDDGERNE